LSAVSAVLPRRFALVRAVDDTGVSVISVVAFGIAFSDGHVVLRWCSAHPATSSWTSLDDVLAVHGRDEGASFQWIDAPATELEEFTAATGTGRRARRQAATESESTSAPATTVTDPSPNGFPWPLDTDAAPAEGPVALPPRQPGRHRRTGEVEPTG